MIDAGRWLAFATISLFIGILPGPGVANIVAFALHAGLPAARSAILGAVTGNVFAMTVSLTGLGSVLLLFPGIAQALAWVGALYLLALGVACLRSRPVEEVPAHPNPTLTPGSAFASLLAVSALNPNSILFFLAFVPQFIDVGHGVATQGAILVVTFALMVGLSDTLYATIAVWVAATLGSAVAQARARRAAGLILVSTGLLAAYAAYRG